MIYFQRYSLALASLVGLCVLIFIVYSTGLSGGLWLDDYGVLPILYELIETHGFWYAVLDGDTGPLGRVVSLISFALQAGQWPELRPLLLVNVGLHVLNAALVYCLVCRVLIHLELRMADRNSVLLIAGVISLLWALAPIQVSSVLYLVQRMVLLSSTFVLLSLHSLLSAWVQNNKANLIATWAYLMLSGLLALVGLFAKESAFLIVFYAGTLLLLLNKRGKQSFLFVRLLPSVFVLAVMLLLIYLLRNTEIYQQAFLTKGFTLTERLMTEARVLWVYLRQILAPEPSFLGLFHDDFILSKGWAEPVSTAFSMAAWLFVFLAAFYLRAVFPWLMLVCLWFVGGHSLESSALPLELYFEHRNYLPSLAIWFSLVLLFAYLFRWIESKFVRMVVFGVGLLYVTVLGFLTSYTVSLWGKPKELSVIYAQEREGSLRSQSLLVDFYQKAGRPDLANAKLIEIQNRFSDNLAIELVAIQFACIYGEPYGASLSKSSIDLASTAKFSNAVLVAIGDLIAEEKWQDCDAYSHSDLLELVKGLHDNPKYDLKSGILRGFAARTSWNLGYHRDAVKWLEPSAGKEYEHDLLRVIYLATLGDNVEALGLIQSMKENPKYRLKFMARSDYLHDLENTIRMEIDKEVP